MVFLFKEKRKENGRKSNGFQILCQMLYDFLTFREFRVENTKRMGQAFVRRIIIQLIGDSMATQRLGKVEGVLAKEIVVAGYEITRRKVPGNLRMFRVRIRGK